MSKNNGRSKLADVPALAAICVVTTTIALIVALVVSAPNQVTAALALLLAALGLCIWRA